MSDKKLPLTHFIAELNYLEFYQSKTRSAEGTYRVIEDDDTINYCVIAHSPFRESWYSNSEYQDWEVMGHRVVDLFDYDLAEDLMDSWDKAMIAEEGRRRADEIPFDELTDTEFNQMVSDVYERNEEESRVFDQRMSTEPKTLGQLLREYNGSAVKASGIEVDTSGMTKVFEDGKPVNLPSFEEIRERAQESLKATDVVRDESGDCYLLRGFNA